MPEDGRALAERLAHLVQPGCGGEELSSPPREQGLEELRLVVGSPQWIVDLGALDLLDLGPHVVEKLAKVTHGGAPLGGQVLALLTTHGEPPLEGETRAQVVHVDHTRGEARAEAPPDGVDDRRITRPDRATLEQ